MSERICLCILEKKGENEKKDFELKQGTMKNGNVIKVILNGKQHMKRHELQRTNKKITLCTETNLNHILHQYSQAYMV